MCARWPNRELLSQLMYPLNRFLFHLILQKGIPYSRKKIRFQILCGTCEINSMFFEDYSTSFIWKFYIWALVNVRRSIFCVYFISLYHRDSFYDVRTIDIGKTRATILLREIYHRYLEKVNVNKGRDIKHVYV